MCSRKRDSPAIRWPSCSSRQASKPTRCRPLRANSIYPETVFVFPPADASIAPRSAHLHAAPSCRSPAIRRSAPRCCSAARRRQRAANSCWKKRSATCLAASSRGRPIRGYARFTAPSLPVAAAGDLPGKTEIAAALSLAPDDIGFRGAVPSRWASGITFSFVPVRNLDAAARAHPNPASFEKVFGIGGPARSMCSARRRPIAGHDFHVRMFAPAWASPKIRRPARRLSAFAGLLAASGRYGDGEHDIRIEQGYEMGRPSLIELGLTIARRTPRLGDHRRQRGHRHRRHDRGLIAALFRTGRSTFQNATLRGRVACGRLYA